MVGFDLKQTTYMADVLADVQMCRYMGYRQGLVELHNVFSESVKICKDNYDRYQIARGEIPDQTFEMLTLLELKLRNELARWPE